MAWESRRGREGDPADPPLAQGGRAVASARLRTNVASLGFTPPPVTLRLRLLEGPACWWLFIQAEGGSRLAPLVEWIEPWCPLRIEFGSRGMLRADFDPIPDDWLQRYGAVEIEALVLHPDGAATARIMGTHAALASFGRTLAMLAKVDVREVREAARDTPLLTRAQDEALRAAVDAGYYRIPRPLNLHELAMKLHISPASLSERLRRAEGRVISHYTKEGAMTPWDARTLFDREPPSSLSGGRPAREAPT